MQTRGKKKSLDKHLAFLHTPLPLSESYSGEGSELYKIKGGRRRERWRWSCLCWGAPEL